MQITGTPYRNEKQPQMYVVLIWDLEILSQQVYTTQRYTVRGVLIIWLAAAVCFAVFDWLPLSYTEVPQIKQTNTSICLVH